MSGGIRRGAILALVGIILGTWLQGAGVEARPSVAEAHPAGRKRLLQPDPFDRPAPAGVGLFSADPGPQRCGPGAGVNGGQTVLPPGAAGSSLWAKAYGGTYGDVISAVDLTDDGGYIIAGRSESFSADGRYDFWVLRLDAQGNVLWQKSYGGSGNEGAHEIHQTADSGFIVAGYTYSFSAGESDTWVLKLDGAGEIVWQKAYGGSDDEDAFSIRQTADGGYIVAGSTGPLGGVIDAWVLKLDDLGGIIWQKSFGGAGEELAFVVQQTTDGGYVVGAYAESFGAGMADFWVLKLDGDGKVVWQKTYGSALDDVIFSLQQTADGGYVLAGYTGLYRYWVLKLDADGNVTWPKGYRWEVTGQYRLKEDEIRQTADGGYILVGNPGWGMGWVLKLGLSGDIVWQRYYGAGWESFCSVRQTADGGYVVGGSSGSLGLGGADGLLVRLDASGHVPVCPIESTPGNQAYTPPSPIVGITAVSGADTTFAGLDTPASPKVAAATATTVCPVESGSNRVYLLVVIR